MIQTRLLLPEGISRSFFKSLFIVLLLAASARTANAQWAYYGGTTATPTATYTGSFLDLAVNKTGDAYVFYSESGWSGLGTVVKGNSSGWTIVGTEPCTPGAVAYCNIAVDTAGTPYIAYQDGASGNKVSVMKYDGTTWSNVGGAGLSAGAANYVSLVIGHDGNPWVAYQDVANGNKATVMRFNGATWVTVGTAGLSSTEAYDVSLAVDTNNNAYVAYCDASGGIGVPAVMKYNGTSWALFGDLSVLGPHVAKTLIATDTAGAPYVTFIDNQFSNGVMVIRFDATTGWRFAGPNPVGFNAQYVSMTIDKHGTPYVMFDDGSYGGAATVMQYGDDSWRSTGNIYFTGAGYPISATGLGVDDTGNVYALWKWPFTAVQPQASVSKLGVGSATIMGPLRACAGDTVTLTNTIAGGTWTAVSGCNCVTIDGVSGQLITHNPGGVETMLYTDGSHPSIAYFYTVPHAYPITGSASLCMNGTSVLMDSLSGGTWSSSSSIVTVDTAGIVTGLGTGTADITYTVTDPYGCGEAHITVTVNALPANISGAGGLCPGGTLPLSDATTGGTWSSGAPGIAQVNASSGVVTGILAGTAPITYTSAEGCNASAVITVNPLPAVITGVEPMCIGHTLSLTDPTPGGTWSSGATSIATVDPVTGVVTGIAIGNAGISYTLTTGCQVNTVVPVTCEEGVAQLSATNIGLYPNPANYELTISAPVQINSVAIIDITGKVVYTETISIHGLVKTIDISRLPAGTYAIRVNDTAVRTFTKKQ